jgi:hypothetical protein
MANTREHRYSVSVTLWGSNGHSHRARSLATVFRLQFGLPLIGADCLAGFGSVYHLRLRFGSGRRGSSGHSASGATVSVPVVGSPSDG